MASKYTLQILHTFYKKRYFILIATLVFGAVAFIFSLFVKPKYASEVILYPTAVYSIEQVLDNPGFGYEIQANNLMQLLKSSIIRHHITEEFDLIEHFGIDTLQNAWHHKLGEEIDGMVSYNKTPYSSVSIRVVSDSPELSAEIANYISRDINQVQEELIKNNLREARNSAQSIYLENMDHVNEIIDKIIETKKITQERDLDNLLLQISESKNRLSKIDDQLDKVKDQYGINEYDQELTQYTTQLRVTQDYYHFYRSQYDELSKALPENDTTLLRLKGRMLGSLHNNRVAKLKLDSLRGLYNEIISLHTNQDNELSQLISLQNKYEDLVMAIEPPLKSIALNQLEVELSHGQSFLLKAKNRYERAKDLYNAPLPDTFIVSSAIPDRNPVSPSGLLYTIFGLFIGFILSLSLIWIVQRASELKKAMDKI